MTPSHSSTRIVELELNHISSLPPADGGRDAWKFLIASFIVEAVLWGMQTRTAQPSHSKSSQYLTRVSPSIWRFSRLLPTSTRVSRRPQCRRDWYCVHQHLLPRSTICHASGQEMATMAETFCCRRMGCMRSLATDSLIRKLGASSDRHPGISLRLWIHHFILPGLEHAQ